MSSILRSYLRKRWVRALLGGTVFVVVLYVQYKLSDWPVAVDLDETGKFSPVKVALGTQELVIEDPAVNSLEGMLLAYRGESDQTVHIRFDSARLSDDTVNLLKSEEVKPPTAPVPIQFLPLEVKTPGAAATDGDLCRTFVNVSWENPVRPPSELKFFQLGMSGLDRTRSLEMQATGGELHVNILSKSEKPEGAGEGCVNLLRAGDMEEKLREIGIGIVATSGSAFRWQFRPRVRGGYPWSGADGLFEPFPILGQPQVSASDARPSLQARAVRVRSLKAGGGGGAEAGGVTQSEILSAQSTDGGPLLTLSALKVGSDQLQLNVGGNGWVKINGVDRSVNFFERLDDLSPLGALLFGVLNTAFLEGIRRFIFSKPRTEEPPAAGA